MSRHRHASTCVCVDGFLAGIHHYLHVRHQTRRFKFTHKSNTTEASQEFPGDEDMKQPTALSLHTKNTQSTTLNGSDPPYSSPASKATRKAARYSFSLRPFSPANSVNNMYLESATVFARHKACRTLLNRYIDGGWMSTRIHMGTAVRTHSGMCVREETRIV